MIKAMERKYSALMLRVEWNTHKNQIEIKMRMKVVEEISGKRGYKNVGDKGTI